MSSHDAPQRKNLICQLGQRLHRIHRLVPSPALPIGAQSHLESHWGMKQHKCCAEDCYHKISCGTRIPAHMVPGYQPMWYQDSYVVPGFPCGTRIPAHVVLGFPCGTRIPMWYQDTHVVPGYQLMWYQDTHVVPGYPCGTRIPANVVPGYQPMWYQDTHVVPGYQPMWYQDTHVQSTSLPSFPSHDFMVPHLASSILPLSSTVVYHVIQQVR